ncbi:HAMP domain-containing sensor histidine kinase [Pseudodesulfovibrio sediminis]|uniref:histidine kinase n=1 Tax=Pseudodesulfovibrio sediminis TaxID=2810563 RepID=A0ABM7P4Y1_9BACT|nr:HAMP domain-containing sensor histidine kinase [Pseudodesulfovibrio sediminis]BCS87965.1 two-component sensor histidine kinase [Pseudodesulfovibrio sediminis]
MKIGGLYFRMLLAFVVVQLIAILTMFTLVHIGKIRPPFTQNAKERTYAAKRLVEHELAGAKAISPDLKSTLNSMLQTFASAFQGKIWVTNQYGDIVSSSFQGPVPLTGNETIDVQEKTSDGDTLYLMERNNHKNMYLVGAIPFHNDTLTIHVLHQWKMHREKVWFMEGLLLMSFIAALLLIPVSRKLARPLNALTDSAEQVARGDFSPRVNVTGSGEISVLANAFNHMAENLERIVQGSQELTANLSHELRSPLARIRISQQIIMERLESGRTDGTRKHVEKMEREIDHMDGLIDKILKLSKLDMQETPPHDDVVTVKDLIAKTVNRHQPLIDDKSMHVVQSHADVPPLHCNRDSLQIALDNVLVNAIKYSADKSTITVSTEFDGEETIIRVTNPYPPLSPEEREAIFIPFKRLGYDEQDGNGLGLAFAKKIITEHGGSMHATSQNDTFCMTLRLKA